MPKPRISISMHITTRDNLSVRWAPGHTGLDYRPIHALEWLRHPSSESMAIGERPEDELMFLRGFGQLQAEHFAPVYKPIVILLLAASHQAVHALIARLRTHFDIQLLDTFRLKLVSSNEAGISTSDPGKVPIDFEIVHTIEERHKELHALVQEFQPRHGVDIEEFWAICNRARHEYGMIDLSRASKALRKAGGTQLKPKAISRLASDLEDAISVGIWSAPGEPAAGAEVLPFTPKAP